MIWNLILNLKFPMGKFGKHGKIRGEFRGKFRSKFRRKFRKLRFKFRDIFRKLRSAEGRSILQQASRLCKASVCSKPPQMKDCPGIAPKFLEIPSEFLFSVMQNPTEFPEYSEVAQLPLISVNALAGERQRIAQKGVRAIDARNSQL